MLIFANAVFASPESVSATKARNRGRDVSRLIIRKSDDVSTCQLWIQMIEDSLPLLMESADFDRDSLSLSSQTAPAAIQIFGFSGRFPQPHDLDACPGRPCASRPRHFESSGCHCSIARSVDREKSPYLPSAGPTTIALP